MTSPIPMVLFCPACGLRHIDGPDEGRGWTNPPHRSHLCSGCEHVWRPADVATVGVTMLETEGAADSDPVVGLTLPARELHRLQQLLNCPEIHRFADGVVLEAVHQRERHGSDRPEGKQSSDWFWLVGFLAGKALNAALSLNVEKALHHTISAAAALANWHAMLLGADTRTRAGIVPPAEFMEVDREQG